MILTVIGTMVIVNKNKRRCLELHIL